MHHGLTGVLPEGHIFHLQRKILWAGTWSCHGLPISPIVANLYMESFEIRALQSSPNPPSLWKRFVDDIFVIMRKAHKEEFLTHLNSVDNNIQFTTEEPGPDGSLPFLDILITPDKDGRLDTTVYRKPTHMDQYLHCDSHHTISSKYSVVGTLHHRARTICSNNQFLQQKKITYHKHW